jgi:hypothetical protein
VGLVALEKDGMFSFGGDFENFATISRRDKQVSRIVKREIPDVLRPRIEVDGRIPVRVYLTFGLVGSLSRLAARSALVLDLIDLSIGSRSCVDRAIFINHQGLHLQFGRLEDRSRLPIRRDAVNPRRGSGGRVNIPSTVGSDGPDVGGRGGVQRLESRRQFQAAVAADGYSRGCALRKIFKFRLFPGPGPFAEGDVRDKKRKENDKLPRMDLQVLHLVV